jgi:hypothetical protein
MFANLLATPFVATALVLLYLSWTSDSEWAPWMIPVVLLTALVYIFAPQINWWYYTRRPQPLEANLRALLEQFCGFYRRLDASGRKRFENRVTLYRMGVEWMPMGWPEEVEAVPADVQLALCAQAVSLTWQQPNVLLDPFEQVIVYPEPFPTPEYPFAHASELFAPDGCLIFSARQVMQAFVEPHAWYNVALHEYAKALVLTYPDLPWPDADLTDVWERLEQVSRMPRGHVESVIGLAGVDPLPVMMHHYRIFPEAFQRVFSSENQVLSGILG